MGRLNATMIPITEYVAILRVIYSMKGEEFTDLYGDRLGPHYWMKLTKVYNHNVSKFLSYMDDYPAKKLIRYAMNKHRAYSEVKMA